MKVRVRVKVWSSNHAFKIRDKVKIKMRVIFGIKISVDDHPP